MELRQAGWWEEAIDRTIFFVLFRADTPLSTGLIVERVVKQLDAEHDQTLIGDRVLKLAEDRLISSLDGSYSLSETIRKEYAQAEFDAEALEAECRDKYDELLAQARLAVPSFPDWPRFQNELLIPVINELGARTLTLLRGEANLPTTRAASSFLDKFKDSEQTAAQDTVAEFLDPVNSSIRQFILGHLTHYMLVSAGNLDRSTLDRLSSNGRPQFDIVLDTNVIFSMLDLHYNPSNEAARSFLKLSKAISEFVDIRLHVLPDTIQEAKEALNAARWNAPSGRVTGAMARAAHNVGDVSGLIGRYFEIRSRDATVTASKHFEPYITGLEVILQGLGVSIIQEDLTELKDSPDTKKLTSEWMSFEYNKVSGRSRSRIVHDVVALQFVRKLRGKAFTSLSEARWWFLTVDFGLQFFDKRGMQGNRTVPRCLNPAELVQVLRFWVPRSEVLESALIGGIRLPFSFFRYDNKAEQTSLAILDRLSSYSNVDVFSEQTIERLLTDDSVRLVFEQEDATYGQKDQVLESSMAEIATQYEAEVARLEQEKDELRASLERERQKGIRREDIETGKEISKARLVTEIDAVKRQSSKNRSALAEARRNQKVQEIEYGEQIKLLEEQLAHAHESHQLGVRVFLFWLTLIMTMSVLTVAIWLATLHWSFQRWQTASAVVGAWGVLSLVAISGRHLYRIPPASRTYRITKWSWSTFLGWVGSAVVCIVLTFAIAPPGGMSSKPSTTPTPSISRTPVPRHQ